ncbi:MULTISPECIES: hypothetical protein [Sphingobacterium]|uniref:hypothetical protein n=1 Tax=Sphingobacterium TaxID=28453 RepID=UPI0013DCD550|nr:MULTISPECIES: hypothetical protein [unclassified Sphingobacterium]
MESNEILNLVTVRIKVKDKGTGSGILYKPSDSDFLYIFTAKHCIYGQDFDSAAKPKHIKIDKIKAAKKGEYYKLQKADRIIGDDNDDIVALVIDWKRFPGYNEIPEIKLAGLHKDGTDVWFKGYPTLTGGEKQKSVKGTLNTMDMEGAKFEVATGEAFLKYYKKNRVQGLCKGFSGSGICVVVDEVLYFQGVISRFDKAIGFECISLSTFIESKISELRLVDIDIENHLSDTHFRKRLDQSLKELKPRYHEINFPLPIEDNIRQIDAGKEYKEMVIAKINQLMKRINNSFTNLIGRKNDFIINYGNVRLDTQSSADQTFDQAGQNLLETVSIFNGLLNYIHNDFENIEHWNGARNKCNYLLNLCDDFIVALRARSDLDAKETDKKVQVKAIHDYQKNLVQIISQLNLLRKYLSEQLFIGKKYILIKGEAGSGKSQMLGFMAKQRMDDLAPTILILGQSLNGEQNIWGQICRYFCQHSIDEQYFMEILDRKGQMAGRPVLIFIDAINEGKGIKLWSREFNEFIAILDSYKYIKVVLSYRNSYEKALFKNIKVDEESVIEHQGFKGMEREAVKFFFENEKMTAPIVPYYSMQFSNPLFLRLFTLLYKSSRGKIDVNSWVGTITVYNHFFEHINEILGHTDRFNYESYKLDIVNLAIKKFVKKQWKKQAIYLRYRTAFKLVEKAVSYYTNGKGFFAELISHGLFYENRYVTGHGEDELGVDFAYQKLGEYIKVQFLLSSLTWQTAPSAITPTGKLFFLHKDSYSDQDFTGLIEATAIMVPFYFGKEIFELSGDLIERDNIVRAFISSLKDRSSSTITDETRDYLNIILKDNPKVLREFWSEILQLSFQPANALNTDFIHNFLIEMSLSKRDAIWTVFINNNYEESGSAVLLIIKWALDYKKNGITDPKAIQAIGKTLFWFLGSTNRKLRDYATKVAVFLFTENIALLKSVMVDFEKVNDPYITQRIYAIAFGAVVRNSDREILTVLANYIHKKVFLEQGIKPDILIRDYARLAVEYCRYLGLDITLPELVGPPYKSEKLPDAPADEQITRYTQVLKTSGEGYTGIEYILDSMVTEHSTRGLMYGDFGRYTFGYAVSHWKEYPDNLLSNLAIKMIVEDLGYDQTLSDIDSNPYYLGRSTPLIERIGKKYQWIVFYQILARLADNYDYYQRSYDEKKSKFSGPWEPFVRDFDPTTGLEIKEKAPESAWWLKYSYRLSNTEMRIWLRDRDDLPNLKKLIELKDDNNEEWLVLESQNTWREGDRDLWCQVRSYITPRKQKTLITDWLLKQNLMGRWMPESQSRTELYLREFFWSPAVADFSKPYYGGEDWQELRGPNGGEKIGDIAVTALEYLWERDLTRQDDGGSSLLLPNKYLFGLLKLKHGDIDGQFVNEFGTVIAFDPSSSFSNTTSSLIIRKKELLEALENAGLDIFWTGLGEKMNIGRNDSSDKELLKRLEISSVALFKKNKISVSTLIVET